MGGGWAEGQNRSCPVLYNTQQQQNSITDIVDYIGHSVSV